MARWLSAYSCRGSRGLAPHSLSIPSRGTCRGPLVRQIASGDQVKEAAGDMAGAMSGGTEVADGRIGEEGEGGAFVGRYDGRIMIFMAPQRRRGIGEARRLGQPPLSIDRQDVVSGKSV